VRQIKGKKCLDLAPYYRVFNLLIDKTTMEINLDHTINIQQDRAHHWRSIWYRQGASPPICARWLSARAGSPGRGQEFPKGVNL